MRKEIPQTLRNGKKREKNTKNTVYIRFYASVPAFTYVYAFENNHQY